MATTAGLKDLSFAAIDGGDGAPSATITTASTITGNLIDLLTTANNLLPDEVALRLGIQMTTTGTPAQSGANTPSYQVYGLWPTQATGGLPALQDRDSDLLMVLTDTTTITGVTSASPYSISRTNPRVFAVKGRYLRLRYRINNNANIAGNLKFGADFARIFSKTEG